jgi:RNA polymerase sigma-70 factor (ECF subfamily)
MYQMARNVFSDHYQASKKKLTGSIAIENVQESLNDHDTSDQQLEREEILHKSLAMLPDDQRELLVLARFQHMKYEEVAVIMNTSVANVKVKVHRAIARLREYYFQLERQ